MWKYRIDWFREIESVVVVFLVTNNYAASGDDFFSTFLGNPKSSTTEIVQKEDKIVESEDTKPIINERKTTTDTSFSNWNSWSDNVASQIVAKLYFNSNKNLFVLLRYHPKYSNQM